ncbi:MAG: SRPBCC family protein [bacterium]
MKFVLRVSSLLLIAFVFVCLSVGTHAQVWKSDKERLLEGDVLISFKEVPETFVNEVQAKIYFDAPFDMVWEVLADYEDYSKLFDDITSSELVKTQEGRFLVKVGINNLWPYPDFNYTMEVEEDKKNGKISWKMKEGNLKMLHGSAVLERFPEDKKTVCLTYSMVRDPGWFSPFFSSTLNNRNIVVKRLLALRQKIREKKSELEGNEKEIKPKWEKALFWWQKDDKNEEEKKKDQEEKQK